MAAAGEDILLALILGTATAIVTGTEIAIATFEIAMAETGPPSDETLSATGADETVISMPATAELDSAAVAHALPPEISVMREISRDGR